MKIKSYATENAALRCTVDRGGGVIETLYVDFIPAAFWDSPKLRGISAQLTFERVHPSGRGETRFVSLADKSAAERMFFDFGDAWETRGK